MRTPFGQECDFYYEDFHRGRNKQECRIKKAENSAPWQPNDCKRCPIPAILQANSSPNMELTLNIRPGVFGVGRKNKVTAYCRKHHTVIENPYTGCPQCNAERPGLALFAQALESMDDDD